MDTEPDMTSAPEAFARANERARVEYLRSLTPERAAEDLEAVLELEAELHRASVAAGLPPRLANPLPGPSLAVLLADDSPENRWPPGDRGRQIEAGIEDADS